MKTKFAELVSIVCHPFVTIPIFVFFILFSHESVLRATLLSILIVGGIFVPITIKTYLGVRSGKYTNLDVSDRVQRQRWFIATTVLLLLVTIIMWATNQQYILRLTITCAAMLLILGQLVNIWIKASMHMTFHAFLGIVILYFNWNVGVIFLLFLPLLGWSRLYLKRHFLNEVLIGTSLGTLFGLIFWFFV